MGTKFTIEEVPLTSGTKMAVEGVSLDKGYTTPAALETFINPVKKTGDETISGVKTFASSPKSTGTPSAPTDILNREQGDARWAAMGRDTVFVRSVTGTSQNLDVALPDIITFVTGHDEYSVECDIMGYQGGQGFWINYKFIVACYDGSTFNSISSTITKTVIPRGNAWFTIPDPTVASGVLRWAFSTLVADSPAHGVRFYFRTRTIG